MKMKNMHMYIYIYINVDIQTSLKRMMKACIPLSLAIVHSEHVVHVCVYVLCGQDKRSLIPLLRVDVQFVFIVFEAGRGSLSCGDREYARVVFCFSWPTNCMFLRTA